MGFASTRHRLLSLPLAAAIALGSFLASSPRGAWGEESTVTESPESSGAKALSRAFRAAAEKVVPAVVTVVAKSLLDGESDLADSPDSEEEGSIGSGVIIHSSGLVVTNSHVVQGASRVVVRTSDGSEYDVADIKRDALSDIAVLRLKSAPSLSVARLGDSDELEIGDWVLAVGSPFELDATVSAGIISGKDRGISKIRRGKLLQTDAAINPGNSGGPLVNLDGEVVGINVAIASSSGGYQGVGFAIPSRQVRWVVEQLVRNGRVQRSYLGVSIRDVIPREAVLAKLPSRHGVLVNEIAPGGPAALAGLQVNDVIIEFAGMPVRDARDLQGLVEQRSVGSRHRIKFIRDGKPQELDIEVAALPANAR